MEPIVTIEDKKNEMFLRNKTVPFLFQKMSKKEIAGLITVMRRLMKKADGIGLSANQAGHEFKMFIAQVPSTEGAPKFYAIFNPEIESASKETSSIEEGCLSVPGIFGLVERPIKIVLKGFDKNGKLLKIKAWGLLARVFQHEMDHLNGKLFIDRAKDLHSSAE
jgi:peptide deformylase